MKKKSAKKKVVQKKAKKPNWQIPLFLDYRFSKDKEFASLKHPEEAAALLLDLLNSKDAAATFSRITFILDSKVDANSVERIKS